MKLPPLAHAITWWTVELIAVIKYGPMMAALIATISIAAGTLTAVEILRRGATRATEPGETGG